MGCGSSFTIKPSIINNKNTPEIPKNNSNDKTSKLSQEKSSKKIEQKEKRFDNFEPFTLIYLDDNIDNNNNNQQYRSVIDYLCCFNDIEQCEEFILNNNNKYDHLFFIVSNQYATNIVSHIHDLTQIIAIYIIQGNTFNNKNKDFIDEKWTKRYSKVKGIYLNHDALLEELIYDVKMYEDIGDLFPITVYSRIDNLQTMNSSNDNLCFLFYQLFIHEYCLNSSSSLNKKTFIEIIEDYYSTNFDQLDQINQFYNEYHSTKKIVFKWFLHYSFIRKLLTKSLLTLNLKILFSLRFFIKDIYKIMIDIHSSSIKNSHLSTEQIYYRSQILSEETFERIKSNIGELLSINNFLLVNKTRHDSLIYLRQSRSSTNSIYRILFEIKIPSDYIYNKQRPFIDITHYTTDNYTILFFIGSIFRINKVVFDINNDCWTIQLTLYDEQINKDFSQIFTYINKNTNPIILANLLRQISSNSAEHFYKHLLKENSSEEFLIIECYHGLGHCSYLHQDYQQALNYFEKALEMKPNDKYLKSSLHNSIGLVYAQQNNIEQAYLHFSQALKYTSLPLHKASVYHNLALVSSKQGLYDQELDHYQQAFQIRTDQLPTNHLQVASLLNNIGIAYSDMNQYDQGLSNLKQALEMRLKLLSENHIDIAKNYANIGTVYAKTEEFNMALEYFNKAKILFEKQQIISEQDIKLINKNIKYVNDKLRRKTY